MLETTRRTSPNTTRPCVACILCRLNDVRVVALASTVVGKQVGRVGANIAQLVLASDLEDVLLQLLGSDGGKTILGILAGLQRQVVGGKTAQVGGGHLG